MKTVARTTKKAVAKKNTRASANGDPRTAITPKETHEPGTAPLPIANDFANTQLTLFQTFLANNDEQRDKLSNAIDLWDSVPRYSVSRQAMAKVRIQDQFLQKYTVEFHYRQRSYTCTVSPARVTDFDGIDREYYPSAGEELVEDALRKLAADARLGYYNTTNQRGGVAFTLHALRQEMARRGHTRSYQEIVQSLNILAHCKVEIRPQGEGERTIVSSCLPMLAAASRKQLKDDPDSKWAVEFHPLVAAAIDTLELRQFDYDLMMSHTSQLTRWIHRQLVLKYTYADGIKPFEMRYSTIRRDSRMLENYARERAAIEALDESFKELEKSGVVSYFKREDVRGPRKKLIDVIFTVRASSNFVYQAKAANKRQQQSRERVRLTPPPPFPRR